MTQQIVQDSTKPDRSRIVDANMTKSRVMIDNELSKSRAISINDNEENDLMKSKLDTDFDLTTMTSMCYGDKTNMTMTRIDDSHTANSDEMSDDMSRTLSDQETTQAATGPAPGLSETIIGAIHEPFDFRVRERLLQRGPIDCLKKISNYAQFTTTAPIVCKNRCLRIKKDFDLNVIEEIDKGAFAKIYLVENDKKERAALKVIKSTLRKKDYLLLEIIFQKNLK